MRDKKIEGGEMPEEKNNTPKQRDKERWLLQIQPWITEYATGKWRGEMLKATLHPMLLSLLI
jgi:hypothetical protein